ncbi:MAG: PepSY domain-containing protein [Rhodanobacteraceae bacterium]
MAEYPLRVPAPMHAGRFPKIRSSDVRIRKKSRCLIASTGFALGMAAGTAGANGLDGAKYLPQAKVQLADARAIALRAWSGKIIAEELEREVGGSGLRYSFDIKRDKEVHEVGVDAATGKVLENSIEGPNAD